MRKLPDFLKKTKTSLSFEGEPGQALLVILLIMAVALTIGLSIVSRSITDIKISELSEEGARAFSAAEAGIEEALLAGEKGEFTQTFVETGAKYVARSEGFGEGTEFAFPSPVDRNQVQTLWLVEPNDLTAPVYASDKLRVVWGKPGEEVGGNSPALEVTVYYDDVGIYKAAKFALDPFSGRTPPNSFCNPPSCDGVSNFATGTEGVGGQNFHFGATLDFSPFAGTALLFARLRILYADNQTLAAKGVGVALPSQGFTITSKGTAGAATRKVEVVKYHPAPPAFFDSVLYSQEDLEK